MTRARAELVTALCGVRCVYDPDPRSVFHSYLPPRTKSEVVASGTAMAFAHRLVEASLYHAELATTLRWLRHWDHDSPQARRAVEAAAPMVEGEESEFFARVDGDAGRGIPGRLRQPLRVLPFAAVAHAYDVAVQAHLADMLTPPPASAWEAFVDLYDLPRTLEGELPAVVFAQRVADTASDTALAAALRDWIATQPGRKETERSARPEAPPATAAKAPEAGPARLIVHIVDDPGDPGLLRVTHRTGLCPGRGSTTVFSGLEHTRLAPEELRDYVTAAVHGAESQARRHSHDRLRLEIIVPFSLLMHFPAARWELPAPESTEPARLGSRFEVIYRSHEFVFGESNGFSRNSCVQRWQLLDRAGHGLAIDSTRRKELPPGIRFADHLGSEEIVAFLASDQRNLVNDVMTAVQCGIPVIVWCSAHTARNIHLRFRPFLEEDNGRVPVRGIQALPQRLRALRRGEAPRDDDLAAHSYDISVIYHDPLPVVPDEGNDLTTDNLR
ncbi:hypothetical protein [Allosalinactinospora lopnorensis]|uniref:hypothetical protein n=1 Tax=Allosalinactinospora lopnorensis TaxID=1352348 RepID=UPI000623BE8E|nr:hypothetical protein [Allosalinactinospora lopnorensis]